MAASESYVHRYFYGSGVGTAVAALFNRISNLTIHA